MDTGRKIQNLRTARGMTQEELAEKLAVSRQAVSHWESGGAMPDTAAIQSLCSIFDVSADYLIGAEGSDEAESVIASGEKRRKRVFDRKYYLVLIALIAVGTAMNIIQYCSGNAGPDIQRLVFHIAVRIPVLILFIIMYFRSGKEE